MSSTNLRKIKGNIEKMAAEQQKMEKEEKPKKKAAGKVKVSLRMEGDVSGVIDFIIISSLNTNFHF